MDAVVGMIVCKRHNWMRLRISDRALCVDAKLGFDAEGRANLKRGKNKGRRRLKAEGNRTC